MELFRSVRWRCSATLDPATLLDGAAFGRRTFLKGTTAVAGTLASLSAFGQLVAEAFAQTPTFPVPAAARTPEGGLAAFVAKWQAAGPAIVLTRFGRFLSNRIFNCHVAGTPRAYNLFLGAAGATLAPGTNPSAHANLILDEGDWNGVLYGDFTGLAPLVAGRAFPSRDEANRAALLLIVMYIFAHIPAGADNDPAFLANLLRDLAARQGLPQCEGEPPTFELVDDIEADPTGTIEELALGATRAPGVTATLAGWVHGLRFDQVPPEQIQAAKDQVKNILGVIYAGSTMAPGIKLARAVQSFQDRAEATVIGRNRFRTSARQAAMANSFLAQLLEWEDWTFLAHSGASIVPVVLAVGELAGASGATVLTAIVAGNEIVARAGEFLTDVLHTGNALAIHQLELPLLAAKLLGLEPDGLRDASGIACTQPQVTSIPAWTADAKGLLTGAPAYTAVLAAQLAAQGLTGRRDLLESPLGYFYGVADIASPRRLERAVRDLGTDWRFARQYFNKRYPTDGFQLPAVHATLNVRRQLLDAGVAAAALPAVVERIFARIPFVMASSATMFSEGKSAILDRVLDPNEPDFTYIALLFDGPYALAAALRDGELTQRQYRDDRVGDAGLRALYDKVEMVPDLTMGVFGAEVTVTVAGQDYKSFVDCIRENVNAGFGANDKFQLTAAEVLSASRMRQVLDAIDHLEQFADVRGFTRLL